MIYNFNYYVAILPVILLLASFSELLATVLRVCEMSNVIRRYGSYVALPAYTTECESVVYDDRQFRNPILVHLDGAEHPSDAPHRRTTLLHPSAHARRPGDEPLAHLHLHRRHARRERRALLHHRAHLHHHLRAEQ